VMRTALLAWDYPPSPSGLSTAAREIAMALSGEGCDVTVFTLDRSGAEDIDGVRVVGCDISDQSRIGRLRKWAAIGHAAAPLRFRQAVRRGGSNQLVRASEFADGSPRICACDAQFDARCLEQDG
jgi:glycogen(starch) synthase